MYANRSLFKPEITSVDMCSPVSSHSSVEQQTPQPHFPEWLNEFSKKCTKICGARCSEKLDEIMEQYIQEIKKELVFCDSSPNRASLIANRMNKTLMFFYLYYSDIKEFFVISQWHENISQLLLFYCRLELKAAYRVHRGKDSDSLVSSRIMTALWTYLFNNYEAMIHIVLQIPHIGRRHKDILDPVFRKLLMNKKQKPLTELEYLRNLLAFKLWKRLYGKEDKKAISQLALTELRPPISFLRNYKKYKFLPPCGENADVHVFFVTGLFDLDSAIKEYLEICNKNKRTDYHPIEKKTFISEFCSSFEGIDCTPDDFSDSYMLDKVKTENVEEIEDDCIIIEDSEEPTRSKVVNPTPTEVIDLTADEPEPMNLTDLEDEVPQWCKELIKHSEEQKITPPPSPVLETPVEELKIEPIISHRNLTPVTKEIPASPVKEFITPKKEIITPRKEISQPPPIEETIEDNSEGLTEITSTSHPVQDTLSIDFSEQTTREEYGDNFEHVDSTSNINEEECEQEADEDAPTIKTFVVERTVTDGIVCSEVISEITPECEMAEEDISEQTVSAVSNIDFEQFASQNVSNTVENNLIISNVTGRSDDLMETNRLCDSDELTDEILEEELNNIDVTDNNNLEQLITDKESESSMHSQQEIDDFTSPAIEPVSKKEYSNYLAELEKGFYKNFNNDHETDPEIQVTKRRKTDEQPVKTYTKRTVPKFDVLLEIPTPTPTPESLLSESDTEASKERRVPINGEKVCRFEDVWESIYTRMFNLTPKECKVLMPTVLAKKCNPKTYLPDSENFNNATTEKEEILEELRNPFTIKSLYGSSSTEKKILERQDYLKSEGEENPRVRVITRPRVIKRPISAGSATPANKDSTVPDLLMPVQKKRGPRKQETTEVKKKSRTRSRKSTRPPVESSPPPTPIEQNPETTPWRFSVS